MDKFKLIEVKLAYYAGAREANPHISNKAIKKLWDEYNQVFIKGEISTDQILGIDFKN